MGAARTPRRNAEPLPGGTRETGRTQGLTLGSWRRAGRAALAEAGVESAAAEADFLAAHALHLTRLELALERDRVLIVPERRRLAALLHKRLQRFPLQYLLGDVDFAGVRLLVRPGVFIPRPETEGLVERVQAALPANARALVVDVGTGTGAIALALVAANPGLHAWGTDVSAAALCLARRNARELGLEERARFFSGTLTLPVEARRFPAPLAAVVSNPPYVALRERAGLPPEVRDHEPAAALFARGNGMAVIRSLAPRAARLLPPGGLLALEIGEEQGARVRAILGGSRRWTDVRIERDLAGKDRYALARRAGD